ncbi:NAD(P)-dependent oxidoreductase [Allokutzneria oryzae]|uniref:NAD(P)-dependent oxidoreductase n=1 Tax=Allokutzneria oryzae TaxID=1378989 RepID=A0ABV6A432_9PSEU
MDKRIGFIGLGAMGTAMAANLVAAGYDVTVWNRSPGPVELLVAAGARPAADLEEVFGTGTVLSMLANDDVVEERLLDPALLAGAPEGAVHVNMATVSVELAKRATALHAEHGVGYLAAPVFGRVPVAEAGQLNVLAAGPDELVERLRPVFDVLGKRTWPLGTQPHQANIVKIIGNYLLATAIQSLSEAVSLAEKAGVDANDLVELLTGSLFPGPVYSGYGKLIADREYEPAGFTATLGLKDVNLAMNAAAGLDVPLPFGEIVRESLHEALANGQADQDWASIAEVQRRRARS